MYSKSSGMPEITSCDHLPFSMVFHFLLFSPRCLSLGRSACAQKSPQSPAREALSEVTKSALRGAATVLDPDAWPWSFWKPGVLVAPLLSGPPQSRLLTFSFPSHQQPASRAGKENPCQEKVRAPSTLGFWKRINKIIFWKYARLLGGYSQEAFLFVLFLKPAW